MKCVYKIYFVFPLYVYVRLQIKIYLSFQVSEPIHFVVATLDIPNEAHHKRYITKFVTYDEQIKALPNQLLERNPKTRGKQKRRDTAYMCSEVGFVKRVKCSRHIVYSVRSAGLIPIDSTTECSEVTTEVRSLQTGFSLR